MSTTKSKEPGDINVLSIHDAHLGHDNTTTMEIINGLKKTLPDDSPLWKALDYLAIPGDLFDRLLHLPHHGVPIIRAELRRWLTLAEYHGFAVRVLEGTPSHDWKQSKMIESVAHEMGFKGDLKYFDRLCVEITPKGHSFLYVPDEWRADNEQTFNEAVDAIRGAGLQQVDFCLFHGQFEYQFPDLNLPCHDSTRWQTLIRHYLFAGHIHKPSRLGKILVAGSFDRLCHGEEHPKGFYYVQVRPQSEDIVQWIENPYAKIYVTIDCRKQEPDTLREFVIPQIEKLPQGSGVRLWGTRSLGLLTFIKHLDGEYPQYRWSTKVDSEILAKRVMRPEEIQKFTPITLTKDNLSEMISERLIQRGLPADVLAKAQELLRGY